MTDSPQGPKPSQPSITVIDLLGLQGEYFSRLEAQGKSINTLKNYKTDLSCFNNFVHANQEKLNITRFAAPHIKAYGTYLEEKYQSDNSRRRRVQALRSFFDFLVEKNFFPSNPVRKLQVSPKFLDIPRPTPFAEIKTLWEYLMLESKNENQMTALLAKRNAVAVLLIFGGGVKISDLPKLQREQVHIKDDKPRVLLTPAKRDPFTVPLPKVFIDVYNDYIKSLEKGKKTSGIDFSNVFFNANPYRILSGGLSPRGIESIFEEFRKKLLLTITPKSLRQAGIFNWLHQKQPEESIKDWLGVAPSYSLKLYTDCQLEHIYSENFLLEIYKQQKKSKA